MKATVCLLALAALGAVSLVAPGAPAAERARVACFDHNVFAAQYRSEPRHCFLLNRGRHPTLGIQLEQVHWKRFGGRRAVGGGRNCGAHGCIATAITLRQPHRSRRCDDKYVYTRARVEIDGPDHHVFRIGIRPC